MTGQDVQIARIQRDYVQGHIDADEMEARIDLALRPVDVMTPAQIRERRLDEIEGRLIASKALPAEMRR
jgi:hypothetical protein